MSTVLWDERKNVVKTKLGNIGKTVYITSKQIKNPVCIVVKFKLLSFTNNVNKVTLLGSFLIIIRMVLLKIVIKLTYIQGK